MVKQTVYASGVALAEGLDARGLAASEKTALARSDPGLGREMAAGSGRLGAPAMRAMQAVDLGADAASDRRRCRTRAAQRFSVARSRPGRVLRMRKEARLARITKMPWTTGAQPQGARGHQARGLAPSPMQALRRGPAASAVGKGPGRRLATALGASCDGRDPRLELRRQVVSRWSKLWRTAARKMKESRPRAQARAPLSPALRSGFGIPHTAIP